MPIAMRAQALCLIAFLAMYGCTGSAERGSLPEASHRALAEPEMTRAVDSWVPAGLQEPSGETRRQISSFMGRFFETGRPRALPVVLRLDKLRSHGYESLVDTWISVGDRRYALSSPAEFVWAPGEPLTLSFQWATGARRDLLSPARPWSIDGRWAQLEITEPWALLRLLGQYCATPEVPCRQVVFRFDMVDAATRMATTPTVLVYKVAVLDPANRLPIAIPALRFSRD